jgi:hypothetical protein
MTFELEANGVHISCSSPEWTQKLIERGARLVDQSKAEDLRQAVESTEPAKEGPPEGPPPGR